MVCTTNEGLHARCHRRNDSLLVFTRETLDKAACVEKQEFSIPFSEESLLPVAIGGGFWSYVAGAAVAMLRAFPKELLGTQNDSDGGIGVHIHNYCTTLPLQKGLSSSAAVCVLTVQAIAALRLAPLHLSTTQIMALAYAGESLTPSGCGRMDQCVAMTDGHIAFMTFPIPSLHRSDPSLASFSGSQTWNIDDGGVTLSTLSIEQSLFFVVCDVGGAKDTVAILRHLRSSLCPPTCSSTGPLSSSGQTPSRDSQRSLFLQYLRDVELLSAEAVAAVTDSPLSISRLAACMTAAQHSFDANCMPLCPAQLTAPRLHALIQHLSDYIADDNDSSQNTDYVNHGSDTFSCNGQRKMQNDDLPHQHDSPGSPVEDATVKLYRGDVLAVKGVGSQGDGSAQVLCRDLHAQERLLHHLRHHAKHLVSYCFPLIIPASDRSNNHCDDTSAGK